MQSTTSERGECEAPRLGKRQGQSRGARRSDVRADDEASLLRGNTRSVRGGEGAVSALGSAAAHQVLEEELEMKRSKGGPEETLGISFSLFECGTESGSRSPIRSSPSGVRVRPQ